ncbi:MAG TPA: MFS transporter [Candidatus Angelobacter sp.]|nr:MFS transporter [Candidatus Angelobacter sp.]
MSAGSDSVVQASAAERANQRNAVLAGFLGWTLDAFDFFVLVMCLEGVARDFHRSIPDIALTLTASLAMRPVGALIFGVMADHYGRRLPLMLDIIFYSVVEVCSGLAPNYAVFFALRLLYGIGMGGEWGVGASLTLESIPAKWRGVFSGLLQEGYACGYLLAAAVAFYVYPHFGWRPMFFIGGLPALLSLFIRAKVKEPAAWHESRTDWSSYWRQIAGNWRRFLYLVLLMMFMNGMSHGTQDLYPTFLKKQLHFSVQLTSVITIVSMIGALIGGVVVGLYSDRVGRRRAMVTSTAAALCLIPLWVGVRSLPLIFIGAFLMQFMIQGAWGVIPAHINELSPSATRGFFPGFAYQTGVLCASGISYLEARMGEAMTYQHALTYSMLVVMVIAGVVIGFGPEEKGIHFTRRAMVKAG